MYIFLIISLFALTIMGLLLYKSFLNPVSLYNFVWLVVCFLYGFRLSPILQVELTSKTCWLLFLSSFVFTIICIVSSKVSLKNRSIKSNENTEKIITFEDIKKHFLVWICLEVIETIYSKGFPMLWVFQNNGKTYFNYGIPTVHGFANAYGLTILTILSYLLFSNQYVNKKKKIIEYIIIMLMIYLLMLTRQVIISAVVQIFVVYCFLLKKIPYGKIVFAAVFGIIAFGILGNIRTGYSNFLSVALINTDIYPFFIGIYWVYMYLTMTIANLNKLFNLSFQSLGIVYSMAIYLPTIVTNFFFDSENYVGINYLVTQAFNVSGYSADFYISFGIMGLIAIAAIYGYIGGRIYKKIIKKMNMKNIIYYSIYIQIIFLSFFYNHLFYLPSGFQFIIVYFLFKKIKFRLRKP